MSWDGKIASAAGEAEFPSRADRWRLHRMRAEADAILVGARTAGLARTAFGLSEEARAHRKEIGKPDAPPLVIVVSGRGGVDPGSRVLREGPRERVRLALAAAAPGERRRALAAVAEIIDLTPDRPMSGLLAGLFESGVREVLCEGGGEMIASLKADGLIDRARVTICPLILGGEASPTAAGGPATSLEEGSWLGLSDWRVEGEEVVAGYEARSVSDNGPGDAGNGCRKR